MSRFLSRRFAGLEAYVPGEQPQDMEYVKLNTNESPFPPSPEVVAAVNAYEVGRLNLYPDPACRSLKRKLADHFGLAPENVFLSNGSDDILNFCFMAFCDGERPVAFPALSYGFYPVYAELYGLDSLAVPLREGFRLDPADYRNLGRTIVIANPNAPTGMAISVEEIASILEANRDQVVVSADYFAANCRAVAETRAYTVAELEKLGFETVPSVANFIFTRCPKVPGGTLYRRLKEKGVLVRHWDKPEIADYCRVTIGSRGQMDVFLEKVREILEEESSHA